MAGDAVQQIKERLTIVDVVAPYVELQKAGKNYKGKSPFTNEKTPSFFVSPDRGMYYCFSTSQGGDIFTFVGVMEGVDFKGALKILAEKAGVDLVPEDPKKKSERERQYDVLNEATSWFETKLQQKTAAADYLANRGVTPETIAKWRIGYAPGPPAHGWRDTKDYLEGKQFTKSELQRAGLIKGFDSGKEPYDVFRDRVMFPIFDSSGRVVAFSGRILEKDSEAPKYVNSPETELFNKSEILYGYDKAKAGIRQFDFSLIVEGQFDVVMTHQAGYHNAVAVSGTALTAHHVQLLSRLSNRVVLALDADRAGIAAVKRAAELMLARGMDVKVARMPDGEDPADIIQGDKDAFKKVIGGATHVIEYLLSVLKAHNQDERSFKLAAREEILPYVAKIPNRIDQEHFVGVIAEALSTTADAIRFEVDRLNQTTPPTAPVETQPAAEPVVENALRVDELINYVAVALEVTDDTAQSKLAAALAELTGQELSETLGHIDPAARAKLAFTIENAAIPPAYFTNDMTDKLNEIFARQTRSKLSELKEALRQAETNADETTVTSLLGEIATMQSHLGEPRFTVDNFTG